MDWMTGGLFILLLYNIYIILFTLVGSGVSPKLMNNWSVRCIRTCRLIESTYTRGRLFGHEPLDWKIHNARRCIKYKRRPPRRPLPPLTLVRCVGCIRMDKYILVSYDHCEFENFGNASITVGIYFNTYTI